MSNPIKDNSAAVTEDSDVYIFLHLSLLEINWVKRLWTVAKGRSEILKFSLHVYNSACERSLLYMQSASLKVWKPKTPVLHINSVVYTRIALLN